MRIDGHTDMTKLIVAFRSFANASDIVRLLLSEVPDFEPITF